MSDDPDQGGSYTPLCEHRPRMYLGDRVLLRGTREAWAYKLGHYAHNPRDSLQTVSKRKHCYCHRII